MNENKTNYINNLITEVNRRLAPAVEAKLVHVEKNNGVVQTGLRFDALEINISPTLYIDEIIEKEPSIIETADWIVRRYLANTADIVADKDIIKLLSDNDWILDHVYPMMTSMPNEEWLSTAFLDLHITYYIRIDQEMTTMITHQLAEKNGLTRKEIHTHALLNNSKTTFYKNMSEFLPFAVDEEIPMYVITNESNFRGASAMLNTCLLEHLAEDLNGSLYIFPSSIHEVIAIPAVANEKSSFMQMIEEINKTAVDPIDRLSDNLYIYVKDTCHLKLA